MNLFRLGSARYAASPFSGEGARRAGGRWNPRGLAVAYAASHLSLAVLELLVHVDPDEAPDDLLAFEAEIPDGVVDRLDPGLLPVDWRGVPAPEALQTLGAEWIQSARSMALIVPSAIIPREQNVLVNPAHPDAGQLRVIGREPFAFDPRLWKAPGPAPRAPRPR